MSRFNRRQFLHQSAAGAAALAATRHALAEDAASKAPASERLQVGCVGVGGRAGSHVSGFASLKEVDIVALCDIERKRLERTAESLKQRRGTKPAICGDVRKLIDHPNLDAVVIVFALAFPSATPGPSGRGRRPRPSA